MKRYFYSMNRGMSAQLQDNNKVKERQSEGTGLNSVTVITCPMRDPGNGRKAGASKGKSIDLSNR